MKNRIVDFIETESLTAAEFADKVGVQRSNVSHVLNGRSNPSYIFIQKILEAFPKINSRWLITGEGEMYDKRELVEQSVATAPSFQNNLFSLPNTPEQSPETILQEKTEKKPIKNEVTSGETANIEIATEKTVDRTDKKVTRVLIFYDNHTFEDFRPAE